jgi:hypothetical protein
MRAGKIAAEAVAAHPEKSNRAIAEETGVDERTIRRVRISTAANAAVERRIGLDGKARVMPRRERSRLDQARKVVAERLMKGQPIRTLETHQQFSHGTLDAAAVAERVRLETLAELDIDPETLTPSAKAKLEIAKRMMERKLNIEHAARMKRIDEEVDQRVTANGKKYHDRLMESIGEHYEAEQRFRRLINDHKAVFTISEFMSILKCLHPDNSASVETRADGFRLFNSKKLQLTKES